MLLHNYLLTFYHYPQPPCSSILGHVLGELKMCHALSNHLAQFLCSLPLLSLCCSISLFFFFWGCLARYFLVKKVTQVFESCYNAEVRKDTDTNCYYYIESCLVEVRLLYSFSMQITKCSLFIWHPYFEIRVTLYSQKIHHPRDAELETYIP